MLTLVAGSPAAQSIVINAPNGGETLTLGQTAYITWTASGISQNVKLQLLTSNGVQVGVIAKDLAATPGSYAWTVGQYSGGTAAAGSYKVRVRTATTPWRMSATLALPSPRRPVRRPSPPIPARRSAAAAGTAAGDQPGPPEAQTRAYRPRGARQARGVVDVRSSAMPPYMARVSAPARPASPPRIPRTGVPQSRGGVPVPFTIVNWSDGKIIFHYDEFLTAGTYEVFICRFRDSQPVGGPIGNILAVTVDPAPIGE